MAPPMATYRPPVLSSLDELLSLGRSKCQLQLRLPHFNGSGVVELAGKISNLPYTSGVGSLGLRW